MSQQFRLFRLWALTCFLVAGPATGAPNFANADSKAPGVLHVELKPRVLATQSRLFLGDIANLQSTDLALMERAVALPVGSSPRAGESVVVELDQVQRWVHGRLGLRTQQVVWAGATTMRVSVEQRALPGAEIVDVAKAALLKQLATSASQLGLVAPRIVVQPTGLVTDMSIGTAPHRLSVRPIYASALAKRMVVWVDVLSGERFVRAMPVHFDVSLLSRTSVASSEIAAGSSLQVDQQVEREVDVTLLAQAGVAPIDPTSESGRQQRVVRRLRPGEAITEANVRASPAVTRGEWVKLTSRAGSMALESRVEVLQDGEVGQMVRVRQATSTGAVQARVSAPGRLEMLQ